MTIERNTSEPQGSPIWNGKPSLRRRSYNDCMAEWLANRKRIEAAIAQCAHEPTEQELADAFATCEAPVEPIQKELLR